MAVMGPDHCYLTMRSSGAQYSNDRSQNAAFPAGLVLLLNHNIGRKGSLTNIGN